MSLRKFWREMIMTMSENEKEKCIKKLKELDNMFREYDMPYMIVTPFSCGAYGSTSEIVSMWLLQGLFDENIKDMFDEVVKCYQEVTTDEEFMKRQEELVQNELEKENN